jgi:hypothetical protein
VSSDNNNNNNNNNNNQTVCFPKSFTDRNQIFYLNSKNTLFKIIKAKKINRWDKNDEV